MKNILFVIQLPPPIHGQSLMNKYIKNSTLINSEFNCDYINLVTARTLSDIGKHSFKKYFVSVGIYAKMFKALLKKNYTICYITLSPYGVALLKDAIAVFICKFFQKKVIIHLHGKGIKQESEGSVVKKIFYKIIFNNTAVICLSSLLVDDIQGVYNGKPYVLPNGLPGNTKKFSRKYSKGQPIKIIFLSNLVVSKGILDLLSALKILHSEGVNFSCNLVGNEGDISFSDVKMLIESYQLDKKVFIQGAKYGDDKISELLNADLFVFPTYYKNEAFPLVLLEAMMFGLPVISTDEGGIPEIVDDGITGFLCQQKNTIELADKIKCFIDDPELIEKFGKKARLKYDDNYKINNFETNLINILNDISS